MHSIKEIHEDSELFVDTVTVTEDEDGARADRELGCENLKIIFKLDTSAQTSIIPSWQMRGTLPLKNMDCFAPSI